MNGLRNPIRRGRRPRTTGRPECGAARRRLVRQGGTTLLELMVACLIALIFTLAAGSAYLVNQKAYRRNQEKLALQQMVTQNMETLERKIRSAARADVSITKDNIQLYDRGSHPIASFSRQSVGGKYRLCEDSTPLEPQDLVTLQFTPNADGTVITIVLELQDAAKNRVLLRSSATLRNHLKFSNIGS